MNKNIENKKGASLAETVVYIGLVALLSTLITQVILSIGTSFKEIRATRDIENSAIVALDRITREIRLADSLGIGSEFGTTSGKLVLSYSGFEATTRELSLNASSSLRLLENGDEIGTLTSQNVSITNFFLEEATTTNRKIIRITLSIRDNLIAENPRQAVFYSAAVMRGLY